MDKSPVERQTIAMRTLYPCFICDIFDEHIGIDERFCDLPAYEDIIFLLDLAEFGASVIRHIKKTD